MTTPIQGLSAIHDAWSAFSAAAVAAKTRPPMLGRMRVCTASLTVSTAGILSSTTSVSRSTAPIPMAHPLSIQTRLCGRVMRSVKRAMRPRRGMGCMR